jgi:hypothetical protein
MKVFIANFGRENYLWPECLARSSVATLEGEDVHPLREAGDREAYIALSMATKTTAAGIAPTRPVASRWFNLAGIVEATEGDLWIHREKNELWWTISRAGKPEVLLEPAFRPSKPDHRVFVLHKPANPWSDKTRKGSRLAWPSLHARAQEFLFTEGTMQQLSEENATYAIALVNGDDLARWHSQPKWLAKAEKAKRNPTTIFNARQRAILRMVMTVRETVAHANGQQVERTVKQKNLLFSAADLERYVSALLKDQDETCAITGLPLQFDGEHDDPEMLCSLDRIDSNGHYEAGNLQIVCRFVNRWKNTDDDENFRRLLTVVRRITEPAAPAKD